MNEDILLSIIIPVYNVELYLNECIDSIINQLTNQCEIILVNDGSTDSSGNICKEYSVRNCKIRVIEQENNGAAAARNKGLMLAKGKYVTFIDSDDKIAEDSIKKILSWIIENECDVCFLQASKWFSNDVLEDIGDSIRKEKIYGKKNKQVVEYLASRPKFSGSACNKIYRRRFLKEKKIYFPEDGLPAEDLVFIRDVYLNAEQFDVLEFPYYQYRQLRSGSVTNTFSYKLCRGLMRFVEESTLLLTENKKPSSYLYECAMSFVSYEYSIMLWYYNHLKNYEKESAYKWLKDYLWVLKYSRNKKCKLIYFFTQVFGVNLTCKILNLYMVHFKKVKRCNCV